MKKLFLVAGVIVLMVWAVFVDNYRTKVRIEKCSSVDKPKVVFVFLTPYFCEGLK